MANDAPVVDIKIEENVLVVYRDIILVFPTPLSPRRTTLHDKALFESSSAVLILIIFFFFILINDFSIIKHKLIIFNT